MANCIVMRNGVGKFADVFDSPETIKQAQKAGFHICSTAEINERNGSEPEPEPTEEQGKAYLTQMNRDELTNLAKQRGIHTAEFDKLVRKDMIEKLKGNAKPTKTIPGKVPEKAAATAGATESAESVADIPAGNDTPDRNTAIKKGFFGK